MVVEISKKSYNEESVFYPFYSFAFALNLEYRFFLAHKATDKEKV